MSADTNETRTDQDPEVEHHWASDEAGAAQHDLMAEGFQAAREEEADPDGAAAFDEPAQDTDMPGDALLPDADHALDADHAPNLDAGFTQSTSAQDSPVPEGVAKPENLGGRTVGDLGEQPLVDAETQEEFLSRWNGIQVSFLEDPPSAVESAEALIQDISTAIHTSIEERGSELAAEGRAASDTEQMRLALRQYRAFIGVVLPK